MSNKSLFNKTLFKKDLKILLPIFLVNLVIVALIIPFQYSQSLYILKNSNVVEELPITINNINNIVGYFFISALFSAIYALGIFGYEKQTKAFEMIVSLPFSRTQIFVNKIITGLFVMLVPSIVGIVISYFIIISEPITRSIMDMDMFGYTLLIVLSAQFVVFAFYTLFSMIFGNNFLALIFGSICTSMPAGLVAMIELFFESNGSTKVSEFLFRFTPISVLMSFNSVKYSYLYITSAAILLIIISYILFDMTKMEKLTEFLTFKCLELPFRIIFFLGFAFFGGLVLSGIFSSFVAFDFFNKIIGFAVGGAIGYFVPKTAITKSRVS